MTNDLPLVSVVMPNYNTPEAYLRTAIESILKQTYRNIEFVIVDDASTGDDVQIILSYDDERIVLIQNDSNMHVAFSLNRGIAASKGEYIARMDADDVSLQRRIEKQVRFMQKRDDIDVLCAQAEMFGDRKGVFAPNLRDAEDMKIAIFFTCPIVHPSVMMRASFIRENSLEYRTDLKYKAAEDYEFWSKCVSAGRLYEYPGVLLKYRTHARQVTAESGSAQIGSANRVRKRMLKNLGIAVNQHETQVHYHFCTQSTSPDIALSEFENWARRLLAGNAQYDVFFVKRFETKVLQHFFIIALKALLAKQVSLRQFIKFRLTRKALSPKYYPAYVSRLLFSKRLNRPVKT